MESTDLDLVIGNSARYLKLDPLALLHEGCHTRLPYGNNRQHQQRRQHETVEAKHGLELAPRIAHSPILELLINGSSQSYPTQQAGDDAQTSE